MRGGRKAAGPVIYWCSRDQRVRDNWALLHAAEEAKAMGQPMAVAFSLVSRFLHAGGRQFAFMLRGLKEMEGALKGIGIPFFFLEGSPEETIPDLASRTGAGLVVCDHSPLRIGRGWRRAVAEKCSASMLALFSFVLFVFSSPCFPSSL